MWTLNIDLTKIMIELHQEDEGVSNVYQGEDGS